MEPPPLRSLSDQPLLREREVQIDARTFLGLKKNPILEATGFDGTVIFSSMDGRELDKAECGGLMDPLLVLKVDGKSWLQAQCAVETRKVGPMESVAMDE